MDLGSLCHSSHSSQHRKGKAMKIDDSKKCPVTHLTTNFGAPVPNNRDSLTAGARGPLLAQDVWLNEKLANFVREVIPERRMHAKGTGE